MRYYELLYIVNSNFERKKIDEAMNEIDSRIKKTKSKIINHIIWGKKKLAYPIQGNKYGTYVLVHYQGADNNKLEWGPNKAAFAKNKEYKNFLQIFKKYGFYNLGTEKKYDYMHFQAWDPNQPE